MSLNHKKQLREKRRAARQNPVDNLRETIKLNGINNEVITGLHGDQSIVMKDKNHNVFAILGLEEGEEGIVPTLTCVQGKIVFTPEEDENLPARMKIALMTGDDIIGNKTHQPIVFKDHPKMNSFYSNALQTAVQENNKSRAITNQFKKPANAA